MEIKPSYFIDLRSDTVTRPCEGMREAMARAEVGDDVHGDDPTVIRLQEKVSGMLAMEAGLFVPSGTMANAVAIRTHTQPGDEIVAEEQSHLYVYEGGGYATLSGCSIALARGHKGILSAQEVEKKIRKAEGSLSHYPNASLICLENTSNRGGGTCYPVEILDEIALVAQKKECQMHLDGARLFNAVVASGLSAQRLTQGFDSVSVCLSKGLGAPVGSVLVGTNEFIQRAHRWRKMLGGGMRQAGILAEAGLYAIENNMKRLEEDHRRARALAEGIKDIQGLFVELETVESNMVYVKTEGSAHTWQQMLSELGLLCFALNENTLRFVLHLQIDDDQVAEAVHRISDSSIP